MPFLVICLQTLQKYTALKLCPIFPLPIKPGFADYWSAYIPTCKETAPQPQTWI